ncbi:MAG: carbohydrate ABC transporter permease [Sneathiella sp.]|uniref:carbohydrate ABC transporter permease n=1 Tax=Sneathiella sp. TaxID=1964365 RepID=UPI0030036E4C
MFRRSRKKRGIREAGWGRSIICGIVGLIYFFPVLWIISTAFKTRQVALATPPSFLFTPTLDNFVRVFYRLTSDGEQMSTGMSLFFFNSIFIAGGGVLLAVVIGTSAAYGFSRYPLKGNNTYLFVILTTRMLPPIVVIVPIFLMFRITGLSGSYIGIILLYAMFNLAFSVWMMKSFFDELSTDVEDAARLEGAGEWKVFFKICVPQLKAGLAATSVFAIILTWNEFLFALLLTGNDTRTVPVAMARSMGGQLGVDWGLLAAIITLFLIPVFVVTYLLQNHLLRGVTFGTVKK